METKDETNALPKWIQKTQYTDEQSGEYIRCLFYGDIGSGKTRAASTFPNPYFINTDKGLRTLKDSRHPFIDLSRDDKIYETIILLLNDIRNGKNGFGPDEPLGNIQTIVIDGLTSLGELLLKEAMKENRPAIKDLSKEKAQFDDYGMLRQRFWSITTLLQDMKKNVVATCWPMLEKDEETGRLVGRPNIVGSFRETVGGYFDEYYYLVCRPGKQGEPSYIYEAYTKPYQYWQARSRDVMPPVIRDLTYDKIVRKK
jgi:hypothetical protein